MRRADRLFQIVQLLRGGKLTTAAKLAERLEVSERTIYRDIADLQATGVPILGEAGIGYVMRGGFDLPPLMFTAAEIVALVAGARMVAGWGGLEMSRSAESALAKIEAVVPPDLAARIERASIFAPAHEITPELRARLDLLQRASDDGEVVAIAYRDAAGAESQRDIEPVGLWFWGKVWTVVAWCALREDFRMFRLDRMDWAERTGRPAGKGSERSLQTFLRLFEAHSRECGFAHGIPTAGAGPGPPAPKPEPAASAPGRAGSVPGPTASDRASTASDAGPTASQKEAS